MLLQTEKLMKIPGSCYDNNMEVFEQKFRKALEYSKGMFDMK